MRYNSFLTARMLGAVLLIVQASGVASCVDDQASDYVALEDAGGPHDDGGLPAVVEVPAANLLQGKGTGCNLSGRWIMTEHRYISVLGASQVAFSWYYLELTQQGDRVTMATGMNCGGTTVGLPIVAAKLDDSRAWPTYMERVRYDGRQGTSSELGDQCQISFEPMTVVRGATVATYRDLSVPLPTLAQAAQGSAPGWEDWDQDGHPGLTVVVTGFITGNIFEVSRTWSQYAGLVPRDTGSFALNHQWDHQRVTLGYEDSPLLVYDGAHDPDESQQVVEFTRLMPEQATGDDAARCEAIRTLASTLTPHASSTRVR